MISEDEAKSVFFFFFAWLHKDGAKSLVEHIESAVAKGTLRTVGRHGNMVTSGSVYGPLTSKEALLEALRIFLAAAEIPLQVDAAARNLVEVTDSTLPGGLRMAFGQDHLDQSRTDGDLKPPAGESETQIGPFEMLSQEHTGTLFAHATKLSKLISDLESEVKQACPRSKN